MLVFWASNLLKLTEVTEETVIPEGTEVTETVVNALDTQALEDISAKLDTLIEQNTVLVGFLDDCSSLLDSIQSFLFRLNEHADLLLALLVTVVISVVYYKVLNYFAKF